MAVITGFESELRHSSTIMDSMYQFRYKVFHHRLGWSVNSEHGKEIDHYDKLNPYYVVDFNQQGRVDACWRILPTTGAYMLKDTFPQLLSGHAAPSAPNIWELSRFAVDSRAADNNKQAALNDLTYMLLQQGYLFAKNQGIERYITVTSVAMERMLLNAGLRLIRFAAFLWIGYLIALAIINQAFPPPLPPSAPSSSALQAKTTPLLMPPRKQAPNGRCCYQLACHRTAV